MVEAESVLICQGEICVAELLECIVVPGIQRFAGADNIVFFKCTGIEFKIRFENVREIREELDTEIVVGELIETIEYDYPTFHLSMDCFWAEIVSGDLVLKEHEAAKWLTKDELGSVEWLPADITLVEKIGIEI